MCAFPLPIANSLFPIPSASKLITCKDVGS
jgi:hypothetical protein